MAVSMVVLYHYELTLSLPGGFFASCVRGFFRMGAHGVDLFFVLSGLLIGGILVDHCVSPRYFEAFYMRRFHRILPLYYLWLAVYFILAAIVFPRLPAPIGSVWLGWRPVLIYAVFLQNALPKVLNGLPAAWLGPLWSLAVEEQFYLAIPLAVRFLPRRRLVQLLGVTVLLSPVLRMAFVRIRPGGQFNATPLRADALAMGVLLALALRDRAWAQRIRNNVNWLYAIIFALLTMTLGFASGIANRSFPFAAAGEFTCVSALFSSAILLALMHPEGWWASCCKISWLCKLGGISYCVYVIHLAVITWCESATASLGFAPSLRVEIVNLLISGTFTWAVAAISWRLLEMPMVLRGHRYQY